jgi:hypothetical protein
MYTGNDTVNPTLPIHTDLFVNMTEPLFGKGHILFYTTATPYNNNLLGHLW